MILQRTRPRHQVQDLIARPKMLSKLIPYISRKAHELPIILDIVLAHYLHPGIMKQHQKDVKDLALLCVQRIYLKIEKRLYLHQDNTRPHPIMIKEQSVEEFLVEDSTHWNMDHLLRMFLVLELTNLAEKQTNLDLSMDLGQREDWLSSPPSKKRLNNILTNFKNNINLIILVSIFLTERILQKRQNTDQSSSSYISLLLWRYPHTHLQSNPHQSQP